MTWKRYNDTTWGLVDGTNSFAAHAVQWPDEVRWLAQAQINGEVLDYGWHVTARDAIDRLNLVMWLEGRKA